MKCPYCGKENMYPLSPGENLSYFLGIAKRDNSETGTETNCIQFIDAHVCRDCNGLLLKTNAWDQ